MRLLNVSIVSSPCLVRVLPPRQVEPFCCHRKLDCRAHCLQVWSPFFVVRRRFASQEEGQVAHLRPRILEHDLPLCCPFLASKQKVLNRLCRLSTVAHVRL